MHLFEISFHIFMYIFDRLAPIVVVINSNDHRLTDTMMFLFHINSREGNSPKFIILREIDTISREHLSTAWK